MTKEEKIAAYNPSGIGADNGHIFGLPFGFEDSDTIIIPVPWEVTTSFGSGTSKGPQRILDASPQLDLYHFEAPNAWKQGIYMLAVSEEIEKLNKQYKTKAQEVILLQEKGKLADELSKEIGQINEACETLRKWVFEQTTTLLNRGKRVILLGGDHSTPLGYLQALGQKHEVFGILQIDAHADLRKAYEGFRYSHASVMYNALEIPSCTKLVQVGIRDICEEEVALINTSDKVVTFYDRDLKRARWNGESLQKQWESVIAELPQKVYVSFDIDGLDPKLCPNTGTPVPGGFEFHEATELLSMLKKSGKEIIGCDLNEVGNDDWDANVGARILYEMCVLVSGV